MTCAVVFEVCQQGQWVDKGSCAKVEQQRTRALFNALLMHSRLGWNVHESLWTVKNTICMLEMNTGK